MRRLRPCRTRDLVAERLICLKGKACTDLKAGKQLTATFPCGGAIPVF